MSAINTMSGNALVIPSPLIGNLESYIRYTNQLPMLTEKEEYDLAVRLRDHNDLDAARQLVMSHLRLVVSTARNFLGYGLPLGDLIQEGNIGLMKAVRRFNPERKVRLVTYALHWIKAYIFEFIQKNVRMVRSATTKAKRKLFYNLRSLKKDLGALGHTEATEISKKLGVSAEDVLEMDAILGQNDVSLEGSADDDSSALLSPIEYLASENARPDQLMEAHDDERMHTEGLHQALALLDDRAQQIVKARWLSAEPETLHQLAAKWGISHERVRQIEERAFKKMRVYLTTAYQ